MRNFAFSVKISIPLENTGVSSVFATSVWPFSLIFPLREEMRETFFRPSLPPYPAALRKFAWPLWWRGRKCSLWYLHQNVPAAPAHPWVRLREREGWSYMYASTDGNEIIHIPDLLSGVSAYAADRCRGFIGSIRPQADEGNLGVIFRRCLCPGARNRPRSRCDFFP